MGILDRINSAAVGVMSAGRSLAGRIRTENRADADTGTVSFDDALLAALLGHAAVSKETALQIPTIAGGIDLIASVVAGTPLKLYRDEGNRAVEVPDDYRLKLLNDETGDTLNANEFWHAMIRDYYTGKGGYAYLNKVRGKIHSIHYVDEKYVGILRNADPIFKDFSYQVNGRQYRPWDFLRILRNTRDGAEGIPITKENSRLIDVANQQLQLEYTMAKRGGNKKGFLKAERRLDSASMAALKEAWAQMYADGKENVVILNNGTDFKESSETSAEMQLDENKRTNALEFAKIFHVSPESMSGSEKDVSALAKLAAIPLMETIQCALNRDLLLEREKGSLYFAFDTKELLKGDGAERAAFYREMIGSNVMQIDEARYMEDLPPLGLNFIKLGLQDVLYNPKTKEIFIPNMNQSGSLAGGTAEGQTLRRASENGTIKQSEEDQTEAHDPEPEARADNNYKQLPDGKLDGSYPSGKADTGGDGRKESEKQENSKIRNSEPPNVNLEEYGLRYVEDARASYPPDTIMAGKGCKTGRKIDDIDRLVEEYKDYGANAEGWSKRKARYQVYDEYEEIREIEIHYYQHEKVGKCEDKIKTDEFGNYFVDEWEK